LGRQGEHRTETVERHEKRAHHHTASDQAYRALAEGLLQPGAKDEVDRGPGRREDHDPAYEAGANWVVHQSGETGDSQRLSLQRGATAAILLNQVSGT